MHLPELERLSARVAASFTRAHALPDAVRRYGRIVEVGPTLLKASLPGVGLGEICIVEGGEIRREPMRAEVVSIERDFTLLSPFDDPIGVARGQLVEATGKPHQVQVGEHLVGQVVDGLGEPLGGMLPDARIGQWLPLEAGVPDPLKRRIIDTPLPLGVRAIDGVLTCGRGQRVGIFAAAGGGKSTLLGMMCDGSLADVVVLALVGERGREVREFLEHTLTPEARARSVIVVATSDRPALERLKAVYTATTIAEYFREQGRDVLLMVDSLTRFARAGREIGLASGEPPAAGGFPPSVFARLPRLLERAGCAEHGSITGIYTVLVEGDNMNEPIADEVRSILDGHIVLSRKLGEANHFPAIDVGASVSRVMNQIADAEHRRCAGRLRKLLAQYKEIELLVRVGEYQRGQDADADDALDRRAAINAFLCQSGDDKSGFDDTLAHLQEVVEGHL